MYTSYSSILGNDCTEKYKQLVTVRYVQWRESVVIGVHYKTTVVCASWKTNGRVIATGNLLTHWYIRRRSFTMSCTYISIECTIYNTSVTLPVFSASSMSDSGRNPGLVLTFSYASSCALNTAITYGTPFPSPFSSLWSHSTETVGCVAPSFFVACL